MKMRYATSVIVLVAMAMPCLAQDLIGRVKALEDINASYGKRLDAVDTRLAAIEAKLGLGPSVPPVPTTKFPSLPPCPGGATACMTGCAGPCNGNAGQCAYCAGSQTVRYWTTAGSSVIYGSDGSVHTLGQGAFANGYTPVGGSAWPGSSSGYSASPTQGCATGFCGASGSQSGRIGLFGRRGR
jgi:hypothetical protein